MIEINGMKFPLDRKYYIKDGAHIWLKKNKDYYKIGMDAFAAEMIGFLTYLKIHKDKVNSGESIGSFESAKFVSRFYSPIDGEIVSVNQEVINNPRKINENPYESWIVSIKPKNMNIDAKYILEKKEDIKNWISEEIKRVEEDE